jgi:hypothetical protein
MRFRPANIRQIKRHSNLPRLLLILSSHNSKINNNRRRNEFAQWAKFVEDRLLD